MVTTMALKRRSLVERKVLALLRGEEIAAQPNGKVRPSRTRAAAGPTRAQARHFVELRGHAAYNGFTILPAGAPYIGVDELGLLAWLASAQRLHAPDPAPGADPVLRAAVLHCAGLLDEMGLRLSMLTTCGARTPRPMVLKDRAA
ncbi:hypothetical protein SCLO_1023200 [Sphingobium cloacae]|uniref:Uncharacterized protein n=2 Tax=Sphingobium cloacae TaxID=120107 RepID=A0A1E1F4A8_9SPHN|nr:hypothetical protein SCLO_1023200 [Sphingobium cloacae]